MELTFATDNKKLPSHCKTTDKAHTTVICKKLYEILIYKTAAFNFILHLQFVHKSKPRHAINKKLQYHNIWLNSEKVMYVCFSAQNLFIC